MDYQANIANWSRLGHIFSLQLPSGIFSIWGPQTRVLFFFFHVPSIVALINKWRVLLPRQPLILSLSDWFPWWISHATSLNYESWMKNLTDNWKINLVDETSTLILLNSCREDGDSTGWLSSWSLTDQKLFLTKESTASFPWDAWVPSE